MPGFNNGMAAKRTKIQNVRKYQLKFLRLNGNLECLVDDSEGQVRVTCHFSRPASAETGVRQIVFGILYC